MRKSRTIVLGVGPADLCSGLLGVAGSQAEPGDTVRIVHAYLAPVITELDWAVPEGSGDATFAAAAELVARAKATLARCRNDISIEVRVRGGSPVAVLEHAATDAELVIVGTGHPHALRPVGLTLSRAVRCPVLIVRSTPRVDAPVTVLLPDPVIDRFVLDAAFAWAARRGTPLVALRPWLSDPDADLVLAETAEQESFDAFLSSWQGRYPNVGVSVELRRGGAADVTVEHAARAEILVVGHARERHDSSAETAVRLRRPATLVVPVDTPRRPGTSKDQSRDRTAVIVTSTAGQSATRPADITVDLVGPLGGPSARRTSGSR